MMTRRRFAWLLASLPMVGKLMAKESTSEAWRAGSYSQAVLDVVDGKPKVKAGVRTWRLQSADGIVRAYFSSSESAEWYKNRLFAMTIDMDKSAAVWATEGQLTGQSTGWMFRQIGPRFVNLEAATEWMKGLTITKGE